MTAGAVWEAVEPPVRARGAVTREPARLGRGGLAADGRPTAEGLPGGYPDALRRAGRRVP